MFSQLWQAVKFSVSMNNHVCFNRPYVEDLRSEIDYAVGKTRFKQHIIFMFIVDASDLKEINDMCV